MAMSFEKLRRPMRLYLKIARLSTFCAFVGAIAAVLLARSVYGSVAQSIAEVDREWARRAGALDEQAYQVRLNGQTMTLSSHMVDDGVHDVLDAADEECRARSAGFSADIAKLPDVAMVKLTSWMFGVLRRESKDHGYVACIVPDGDRDIAGYSKVLSAVAQTGDIGKLGTFRYVIAERSARSTRTHVLRHWTEGAFNLKEMFPAQGDAPGTDLAGVARPEGARRILDASVDGSPFGVRVYDGSGVPATILDGYQRDLVAKGWTSVSMPDEDALRMRVFDHGGADLFITASKYGDRTVVSIASVPAPVAE
jgi:hypothetical protein